jgi:hypothetical protein
MERVYEVKTATLSQEVLPFEKLAVTNDRRSITEFIRWTNVWFTDGI